MKFKYIIYDFDGVFTDNRVIVDENGKESVVCNRSDGLAVSEFRKMGIHQVIVSTEKNPVVAMRAEKLQIPCFHGVDDKRAFIESHATEHGWDLADAVYFGNDLNDFAAMEVCGTKVCPNDAFDVILNIADVVTERKGGEGVIREFFNRFMNN